MSNVAPARRAACDREVVEGDDLERRPLPRRDRPADLAQHRRPLLGREQRRLAGMDADRDDQPVDETAGAPDHVDMAVGHGSKVPV